MLASCSNSQPSRRPIGRLPTSPRNTFATGLLKGAKPRIAPSSAAATMEGTSAIIPVKSRTSAALTGTSSATVIQSMPSMKLTRLISHTPAKKRHARSIHHGTCGSTCACFGNVASTRPTAMHCTIRRAAAGAERMSSIAPTTASSMAAAVTASHWPTSSCTRGDHSATAPQATAKVATTTATPPPCGVGSRWDERAFGFAIAWRASHGRSSTSSAELRKSAKMATGPRAQRWPMACSIIAVWCPPDHPQDLLGDVVFIGISGHDRSSANSERAVWSPLRRRVGHDPYLGC